MIGKWHELIVFITGILDSSSCLAFEKFFKPLISSVIDNEGSRITVSIEDCGSFDGGSIPPYPPFYFIEVNPWN